MSETLPPRSVAIVDGNAYVVRSWYTLFEGWARFIQTPPEAGSTGTAANYDVGTSGGRVPVLDNGTTSQPNTWGGYNVFVRHVTSQAGFKVQGLQVVGPRGAAIADASGAAAAPTQAEFNALVAQFNLVLAMARTHGLIAT